MTRGKRSSINLNRFQDFTYALQHAPEKMRNDLREAMDGWAAATQGDYDSTVSYGSGFTHVKGKSFYKVEDAEKNKGMYVSVGHEAYIARFLEVGTKAHDIPHKHNGRYWITHVSGIKGSKALSNVWDKRRKEIPKIIKDVIKKAIEGGE